MYKYITWRWPERAQTCCNKCMYILSRFRCVWDYRQSMDCLLDLLNTCINHSELHFTDHWHTQTGVLSLLQSQIAVSWQRLLRVEILQLSPSRPLFRVARAERTLVNWQLNWLGRRLAAISHQPPSLLFTGWLSPELSHSPTSYFTSLHSTELLTTDNSTIAPSLLSLPWWAQLSTAWIGLMFFLIATLHGSNRKLQQ
jgi:hypothetical protein